MSQPDKLMIGDYVDYSSLSPVHGEQGAFVIGYPDYGVDSDTVILATPLYIGMPISTKWCKPISNAHDVSYMRERYLKAFPGHMLEE